MCDNGWVQNLNDSRYNKISKRSPYDLGIRTPIMYKWKGEIYPERNTEDIVSSIDMVPTVLSILGIEQPKDMKGIDVLDQEQLKNREAIFGEIYAHDFETIESSMFYNIAITKPYKLILPDPIHKKGEKIELFNIDKDPYEKVDLSNEYLEVVSALTKKIEEFRKN